MESRLNGLNPLSYLGVNAYSPPNLVSYTFSPTQNDSVGYALGALWLNTTTQQLYVLVSLVQNIATWVLLTGPNGPILSLTGNTGGAVFPLAGNINVVGDGTTISIAGNPGTHTLTASFIGSTGLTTFHTDNGDATVAANAITFNGVSQAGSTVLFSGSGATVRLNTTDASANTFIGLNAGHLPTTGTSNTGVGHDVMHAITSGIQNTALGASALALGGTDSNNTAIGYQTLAVLSDADSNLTAVGSQALSSVTVAFPDGACVAVGSKSMKLLNTGGGCTAIGFQTLESSTADSHNTAMGWNSMALLNGGSGNTGVGAATLSGGAFTGSNNTAIGYNAGAGYSGTDSFNIAIGALNGGRLGEIGTIRIGSHTATASNNDNTFIGHNTGNVTYTVASAQGNTAIGSTSMGVMTTAAACTAVGTQSLFNVTSGSLNVAVGALALENITTGGSNIGVGSSAGSNYTSNESFNVVIGAETGKTGENGVIRVWNNADGLSNNLIFIGSNAGNHTYTTAAQDIGIGSNSLLSITSGGVNVAVGHFAMSAATTAQANTACGHDALGALTTGASNVAIGYDAAFSITTGSDNTAVGQAALLSITTSASQNVAVGSNAGSAYTGTESNNVVIGYSNIGKVGEIGAVRIGSSDVTGSNNQNTFVGLICGNSTYTLASGINNTAMGAAAYDAFTTGQNNTAIGHLALTEDTTGSNNTAIGNAALSGITTGSSNTALGSNAGVNLAGTGNTLLGAATGGGVSFVGSQNIIIGNASGQALNGSEHENIYISHVGVLGETNTTRIGTQSGGTANQTKCFISGIRGVTTGVADAVNVLIDSAGQLGTVSSSARFKENIKDMGDQSSNVMKLRPVTFNFKNDTSKRNQFGLIAEEVDEIMPELVIYHPEDGTPETIRYHEIAPMLLNELKKLTERVQKLEAQLKL